MRLFISFAGRGRLAAVVAVSTMLMTLLTVAGAGLGREAADPTPLRIGLSGTMLHELPEATAKQALENMRSLIETQTGLKSEMVIEEDVNKLAEKLAQKKFDFGVFLGYEFAWSKLAHPALRPLVVATSGAPMRVHLIVRNDNPATGWVQLQGKVLALSRASRPPARLYVERECLALGKPPEKFFGQMTAPETLEDEIDDVVDGAVQATAVDTLALDAYKRRKPGRSSRLKEIQKSQLFPAPVIAYQPGAQDDATLARFRDDLVRTNQNADGQRLLNLWKLTGFEVVPDNYEKELTAIAKTYPPNRDSSRVK